MALAEELTHRGGVDRPGADPAGGPSRQGSVDAAVTIAATVVGGRTRLRCRGSGPLVARVVAGRVLLTGATAGPLGGDVHRVRVAVGPGACVEVGSVAAAIVTRGTGVPAAIHLDADVAEAGFLDWRPQPVVVAEGAVLELTCGVRLARRARVRLDETIILGRHGEGRGRARVTTEVVGPGRHPILRQQVDIGAGASASLPGAGAGDSAPLPGAGAGAVASLPGAGAGAVAPLPGALGGHDELREVLDVTEGGTEVVATSVRGSAVDGWTGRWSPVPGVHRQVRWGPRARAGA